MIGRILIFLIVVGLLGLVGLVGYAYSGLLAPQTETVTVPVTLNSDD